jgi:hypothetical protein
MKWADLGVAEHFWARMGEAYRFRMGRPDFPLVFTIRRASEAYEHRLRLKPNSPRSFDAALNRILQFDNVAGLRLTRID